MVMISSRELTALATSRMQRKAVTLSGSHFFALLLNTHVMKADIPDPHKTN
jgi:hypothetical protein